jgi:hypothetical protein
MQVIRPDASRRVMTKLTALRLYSAVQRNQVMQQLRRPIQGRWRGDLLISNGLSAVLARLGSDSWQMLTPTVLRREIRQSNDCSRRRPWSRLELPKPTLLFCQPKARRRYVYVGELHNYPFGGHGVAGGSQWNIAWTDFQIRPPLPQSLWNAFQFRALYIDDKPVSLPDAEFIEAANLFEVLNRIRRRRRATVRMDHRVRGKLIYSKDVRSRILVHEHEGAVLRARASYEQAAHEALFLFWVYGTLTPSLDWRIRTATSRQRLEGSAPPP